MGNGHNLPLSLHGIRVESGDLVQQPVHGADVVREQGFAHQPEQQCYVRSCVHMLHPVPVDGELEIQEYLHHLGVLGVTSGHKTSPVL